MRLRGHDRDSMGISWLIVALLMAFSFASHFHRISMPVAGDRIMREYGLTPTQMGWVYSALLIGYTAFMVPGGWLSDRRGARAALLLVGLGTALFGMLTGCLGVLITTAGLFLPALLVVRGLDGVCMAPLYPAAGRAVLAWVPFRRRALANGLVTGAAPLGVASAHLLFAALMDRFGWPTAFVITGTVTAGLTVVWSVVARDAPGAAESTSPPQSADAHVPNPPASAAAPIGPSLWLLTLSYAAIGYVEYLLFYWSEYYFRHILEFGRNESRYAALLPPLAMAAGMPTGGWASDRLVSVFGHRAGRAMVAGVGLVACVALLFLGTVVTTPALIVACFTLALGSIGLCEGAAWAAAIEVGGARSGTSAAVVNTGGNVGGFIAPVVTPWVGGYLGSGLGQRVGWAWGLRLGCLIGLLGACLWLWIDPGAKAPEDEAEHA
jgi:MFS family permease